MSDGYDKEVVEQLIKELQTEKLNLIAYIKIKVDKGDWHGVADAAMDLREIDAKLSVL